MAEVHLRFKHLVRVLVVCSAMLPGFVCTREAAEPAHRTQEKRDAAKLELASDVGFASHEKYVQHFRKHGREFGRITMEEYLRMAQQLRDRPVGGGILEFVRNDGVITRFDRESGAFIAFDSDRTIRTFFHPNDGEAYFQRQRKR